MEYTKDMHKLLIGVALLFGCAIGYIAHYLHGQTPLIYGQKWHVHDMERPRPKKVDPAPLDNPYAPPSDAIILFDGTNLSAFENQELLIEDGAMVMGEGGQQTLESFGDVQLHIEWASPFPSDKIGQDRGNSGVIFMGKYEVQVLDTHTNETYADGQAAAVYGVQPPMVNAARPSGEWQIYDIFFRAPRFSDEGELLSPARVTVVHNGVLVQFDQHYNGPSTWRKNGVYEAHATKLPLKLQWHNSPVRYRNIWIRPLDEFNQEVESSKAM